MRDLFAVLLLIVSALTGLAKESQLANTMESLDRFSTNADRLLIASNMAEILKLDQVFVSAALSSGGFKCSEVVFMKVLADKSGQTVQEVMSNSTNHQWTAAFQKQGIKDEELVRQMEEIYADLAFRVFDTTTAKKKKSVASANKPR